MPSRVSSAAMPLSLMLSPYMVKIRCTTGAAAGSGSSLWMRWPMAALDGLGWGPASVIR